MASTCSFQSVGEPLVKSATRAISGATDRAELPRAAQTQGQLTCQWRRVMARSSPRKPVRPDIMCLRRTVYSGADVELRQAVVQGKEHTGLMCRNETSASARVQIELVQ